MQQYILLRQLNSSRIDYCTSATFRLFKDKDFELFGKALGFLLGVLSQFSKQCKNPWVSSQKKQTIKYKTQNLITCIVCNMLWVIFKYYKNSVSFYFIY